MQNEDSRNLQELTNSFAFPIIDYWGKKNITEDKIIESYRKAWARLKESKNYIQEINKINEYEFTLETLFKYVHKKNKKVKIVSSKIAFTFNEEGKITMIQEIESLPLTYSDFLTLEAKTKTRFDIKNKFTIPTTTKTKNKSESIIDVVFVIIFLLIIIIIFYAINKKTTISNNKNQFIEDKINLDKQSKERINAQEEKELLEMIKNEEIQKELEIKLQKEAAERMKNEELKRNLREVRLIKERESRQKSLQEQKLKQEKEAIQSKESLLKSLNTKRKIEEEDFRKKRIEYIRIRDEERIKNENLQIQKENEKKIKEVQDIANKIKENEEIANKIKNQNQKNIKDEKKDSDTFFDENLSKYVVTFEDDGDDGSTNEADELIDRYMSDEMKRKLRD